MYKKEQKKQVKKTNKFTLLILFCIFRWQISIIQQTVSMFHKIFLKTLLIKNKFLWALNTKSFILSIYHMKEGMHVST